MTRSERQGAGLAMTPVKAALTVVCAVLGTVLLSEALHWRASKMFLEQGTCAWALRAR